MIKYILPMILLLSSSAFVMAQDEEQEINESLSALHFESELKALENQEIGREEQLMQRVQHLEAENVSENEDQISLKSSAVKKEPEANIELTEPTPPIKTRRVRSR